MQKLSSFFNIFSECRALLDFPIYGSDFWGRCTLKVFVGVSNETWTVSLDRGQVNSLAKRFAWDNCGLNQSMYDSIIC